MLLAALLFGVAPTSANAGNGQWTATSSLGTSVWDFFYDHAGVLWAGTGGSGIYKSEDDGASWTKVTGLPPLAVWSVSQSPVNTSKYYAADVERVYRSSDSGQTWAPCTGFDDTESVYDVAPVQCSNCQEVYAGTDLGVWRSANSGATWAHMQVGIGPQPVLALATHPTSQSTVWACTENGPYISTDSGQFWALRSSGLETLPHAVCTSLTFNPIDPTKLYLGTWYGLFKSADSGQSWTRVTAVGSNEYVTDSTQLTSSTRALLLVSTDAGLYVADAAQDTSWTKVRSAWSRSVVGRARTVTPPGGSPTEQEVIIASGETTSVEFSTDAGATWTALSKVGQPDVLSLAVSPSSPTTVYAVVGDRAHHWTSLVKTVDSGQTWTALTIPTDMRVTQVAIEASGHVLVGGGAPKPSSAVLQSIDAGATWQVLSGLPSDGWRATHLATQVGTVGGRLGLQIHFRTDSTPWGDTYSGTTGGSPVWTAGSPYVGGVSDFIPAALAVRGVSDSWAAGTLYSDPPIGTVVKSTNSGASWSPTGAAFLEGCTCIGVDSTTGRVFAGTAGAGLYYSLDSGATWAQAGGMPFGTKHVTAVEIPRGAGIGKIWFASDADGVYKSTDGGLTWVGTGGLSAVSRPQVLGSSTDGNTLYAGLLGEGVWHYQDAP